ncbi:MAG: amidohydrolase [Alicyclobacillus sp.]|nr:amidohydrolase [Alicyclobacillus sp.]
MIIDIHGHTVAPPEVYLYQSTLLASRGNPIGPPPAISDELLEEHLKKHVDLMHQVGTDLQLISPRPFHMMHSVQPARVVYLWTSFVNDIIARQCKLHPELFKPVAGLPQVPGEPIQNCLPELERCVKELGFVGCLLNPDPTEGAGTPPGLGDEYWYPLYEKLVELDIPALVHSASCCSPRESYTLHFINEESIAILSLLESRVFQDFPNLKLIISHAGGAIPYQMGRFRAWRLRTPGAEPFEVSMRRLYYDTCNYSKESLELLLKVIGPDNVLFGTENPGTGSAFDPALGRMLDDLKPVIEDIAWLSSEDRQKVFETNAKRLYKLEV